MELPPYELSQLWDLRRSAPPYPGHYHGRGIVTSAGGKFLPAVYLLIKSLRASGCTLPIQLWHLGPSELPRILHSVFTPLGVECVDSYEIRKVFPYVNIEGWANKPFSILHSPFKEVLFLDADNLALRDPTFLFDAPEYRSHGAIFWPDFITAKPEYWSIKPQAWSLLGIPRREHAETEAGQLLINKERCWLPMVLTMHMNEHGRFFYEQVSYGDKDLFTFGWDLCGQSPFRIPRRPVIAGDMVRHQFAPDGSELFLHGRKWVLPAAKNPITGWYLREEECHTWLLEFEALFSKVRS